MLFAKTFVKSFFKELAAVKSRSYNKRQSVLGWLSGPEFGEFTLKATNEALNELLSAYIRLKQTIATRVVGETKQLWLGLCVSLGNMLIEQFITDKQLTGHSFLKRMEEKVTSTEALRKLFLRQPEAALHDN